MIGDEATVARATSSFTPWLLDAIARPHDPVFSEILEGVVQLVGHGSAELIAPTGEAVPVVILAAGSIQANQTIVAEERLPVPVEGGGIELRIRSGQSVDGNLSATAQVIAGMIARLLEDRRSHRLALDEARGLVVVRSSGHLRVVSPLVCAATGFEADDAIGRNVFDHIHADDHDLAVDSLARTASFPGEKFPYDLRFLCRDGSSCLLEVTAEDRVDAGLDDIVFAVRPIDQRRGADAVIGDQWRILDMIGRGERLENTLCEIARLASDRLGAACAVMIDQDRELVLRVVAAHGFSPELQLALDGTPIGPHSNTCGIAAFRGQAVRSRDVLSDPGWEPSWSVLNSHGIATCWADPILSDRSNYALGALAFMAAREWTPSTDDVRVGDLFASLASVAVQRAQAEAVLHHQAMHDQLTGLPNRALFLDRLEQALAQRRGRPTSVAVLFIDLDRFKIVNDALGHEAGDELLVAVAARIQSATRTANTVARFGGDEFTVLVDDVATPADAFLIGERIAEAFRQPLQLAVGDLVMTVSVGIAISVDDPVAASSMLRDADAAMYRAKHRGRNRVELFDSAMRSEAVARLELVHALQDAVHRKDFALHYQAQVDLQSLRVVGAEALLRWPHPTRGLVGPPDFMSIAEESGAIVGLGNWVLERACHQLQLWDASGAEPLPRIWVNISAAQLSQHGFPTRIQRLLDDMKIDPVRIGFELTERALMSDIDAAIASLSQLKDLGVSTAIDDFGTGYASLNYLRKLPVDMVKIDKTFIDGIGVEPSGLGIVSAIVALVHATNAYVVAEGVEREEQFLALQSVGCDAAQGFWFSDPAPADAVPPRRRQPPSARVSRGAGEVSVIA